MIPLSPEKRAAITADLREGLRYKAITARHGVSRGTIGNLAKAAGLARGHGQSPLLTVTQANEVVARYQSGETGPFIGRSLGVAASTIWNTLERNGVAARGPVEAHQRCTLRHDALDVLTPEAAYWCGFIFTDGSVVFRARGGTPEVSLTLAVRDREHVEAYRAFFGSTHTIIERPASVSRLPGGRNICGGPAIMLSFRSRRLAERLLSLGRYEGPVDSELAASRDFWRGVIDGDGHIGTVKHEHRRSTRLSLVGSHRLLDGFCAFAASKQAGRMRREPRPCKGKNLYEVTWSYNAALLLIDCLYTDAAIALRRKADAAAQIMQLRQAG
jgi:hypothetical protein